MREHERPAATMFEVVFRNARLDEIDLLRQLEREAATRFAVLGIPPIEITDACVLAERIGQGQLLIAEVDGRAVGLVIFSQVDGTAYIEELDVHSAFAHRRLGAALIDAVEVWAKPVGLSALTLSTFRDIPFNAPYYGRLGFVIMREEELGPGLTAIAQKHASTGVNVAPRVWMRRQLRSL